MGSRERGQVHQAGAPPPHSAPALQRGQRPQGGDLALVHHERLLAVGDGLLRHSAPAPSFAPRPASGASALPPTMRREELADLSPAPLPWPPPLLPRHGAAAALAAPAEHRGCRPGRKWGLKKVGRKG